MTDTLLQILIDNSATIEDSILLFNDNFNKMMLLWISTFILIVFLLFVKGGKHS